MSRTPRWKVIVKGLVKRTLARFGFYLGRFPRTETLDAHLQHLLSALRIDCVFDVGAHHGEFGGGLRELGYAGHIFSFEPIPEHFVRLQERARGDARWHLFPFALGKRDDTSEINIYSGSSFCSFLPPSEYGLDQFGERMQLQRTEEVVVHRLDNLFDDCLRRTGLEDPRVFLKMDTQGFDGDVLEGAGTKLERISAVQAEVSVKPLYDGMTTGFAQFIDAMQQRGFETTGLYPVTRDPGDQLRIVEFDCVMCRPAIPVRESRRNLQNGTGTACIEPAAVAAAGR